MEGAGIGDCGGGRTARRCRRERGKPALKWQSYEISFRAPRLGADGKIAEKPRVTVVQNGIVVQNNTEIPEMTGIQYRPRSRPDETGPDRAAGPRLPGEVPYVWGAAAAEDGLDAV